MHCGASSNYGLQHMIDYSTLIALFKFVFDNFLVNYHITSHTTRHSGANMDETLDGVRELIRSDQALAFAPGRTSPYEVNDYLTLGQHGFMHGNVDTLASEHGLDEHVESALEDYD